MEPLEEQPPSDRDGPALAHGEGEPPEPGHRHLQAPREPGESGEHRRWHEDLDQGRDGRAQEDERQGLNQQGAEDQEEGPGRADPGAAEEPGQESRPGKRGQHQEWGTPGSANTRVQSLGNGHQQYRANVKAIWGNTSANRLPPPGAVSRRAACTIRSPVRPAAAMASVSRNTPPIAAASRTWPRRSTGPSMATARRSGTSSALYPLATSSAAAAT